MGLRLDCREVPLVADSVDQESVKQMKEAGCWQLAFGFESGSQKILDTLKKRITVESMRNSVKLCKEYNIKVKG